MKFKQKNSISENKLSIVFFDGYCGLCDRLVDYLLKKDKKKKLHFASRQSEFAKKFMNENLILSDIDTVIFFKSGNLYMKSSAIIRVISQLDGIWKLSLILLVIPAFLRNIIYDWISKKRYLWFGKKDTCYLPRSEFKNLFYDNMEKQ